MSGPILLGLRLALIVILYAFLGGALYLLWQDLRRQSEMLTWRQIPPIALRQPDAEGGQEYRFARSEVLIGRDPTCDLPIADVTVSSRHARLSFHHQQWWLEDLGSRNGTFLNEQAVTEQTVVTGGDELCFGQVRMQVVAVD